jgi:hypothetical protein
MSLDYYGTACSAVFGGDSPFIQPFCTLQTATGGSMRVCMTCAETNIVPGLASPAKGAQSIPLQAMTCEVRTLQTGSPLLAFGIDVCLYMCVFNNENYAPKGFWHFGFVPNIKHFSFLF